MASFTDNPQLLTNFNPYVQQLPVDAMREVGMYKQAKYDEGVQKIQTTIDNVAGLDVVRDVDKGYLQSKLNELGNNLKTVAAGDFSNFQLVNSTASMANNIAKDATVQNAVMSTAKYRKEAAFMESQRKEGKGAVENEWDFKSSANKWLTSSNVDESFDGKYQSYIDVNKKWMDVMKTLHSDLVEQDIPYAKNADGSINYGETAQAMQRMSKEVVSSAKIENALRSSLTPDELNQLAISGRYEFRQYDTPDKLAVYSQARFQSQINLNDDKIKELTGLKNLSTSNPETQKNAQSIIDSLTEKNSKLGKQLKDELELIKANPDQAKAFIYKNGAIEQFANAYAWEHNKENVLANPVLATEQWEKKHALDLAQFRLSERGQTWREYSDKQGWKFQQADLDLKTQKQMAELYGSGTPFETYLGENTNVKDPLSAMIDDETAYSQAASEGIVSMVRGIKGTNSVQIKTAIEKYENGDPNWYKLGSGNSAKSIPVEWRDEVDAIIKNRQKAKNLNIGRNNIIKEIETSPEFVNEQREIDNKLKSVKPITTTDSNGRKLVFSPKEIANFIAKRKTVSTGGGAAGMARTSEVTYSSPLSAKEQVLAKANISGETLNSWKKVYGAVAKDQFEFEKRKQAAIQEKIAQRSGTYVPRVTTINIGSEDGSIARRTWENIADATLTRYQGKGGDEKLNKDDIALGKSWVSGEGKNNIIYKKLTQGGKTYLIMSKDGKDVTIPLEATEAKQLPLSDPNEPSGAYKEVVEAQYMFNGSTNPTGNYRDAMFGRSDMPNAKLDVKSDLTWNKSNTAKQYIQLQLNTANGVVPLQLEDNPMSRDNAMSFIGQLTKNQIKQLYLNSPLISDKDKQAIKNL
jgi:hypothetical protein